MTHASKLQAYKQLMTQRGIGWSTAAPPLWQLLWSLGVALPPPLFMGFVPLFLLTGTTFGILFGTGAWVLGNRGNRTMSLGHAEVVALITGTVFGLVMALYIRRLSRKQALGSWSAF